MDRFEFEDLISAYIENDLSLNKRKDFEAYLEKNPSQSNICGAKVSKLAPSPQVKLSPSRTR